MIRTTFLLRPELAHRLEKTYTNGQGHLRTLALRRNFKKPSCEPRPQKFWPFRPLGWLMTLHDVRKELLVTARKLAGLLPLTRIAKPSGADAFCDTWILERPGEFR